MATTPSHLAHKLGFLLLAFCACTRSNDVGTVKAEDGKVEEAKVEMVDSKAMKKAEKVADTVRQKAQRSEKAERSQDLVKDKVTVKKTPEGEPVIEQTGEASSY